MSFGGRFLEVMVLCLGWCVVLILVRTFELCAFWELFGCEWAGGADRGA